MEMRESKVVTNKMIYYELHIWLLLHNKFLIAEFPSR